MIFFAGGQVIPLPRFLALELVEEPACRPKTCRESPRDAQKAGVANMLADASPRPP